MSLFRSRSARDWDWQPDAEGKTCASVSGDLTGVGMQGENGAAAEGRGGSGSGF